MTEEVASWFTNPNSRGDFYAQTTNLGGIKDGTLSIFFEVDKGLGNVTVASSPNG